MYNFNDIKIPLKKEEILQKINEEDIFRKYCKNFKEFDIKFCSELRKDNNPSVSITNRYNKIIYKDFGNNDTFDCFSYIQKKYNCNFSESLNIIENDFSLNNIKVKKEVVITNDILPKDIISKSKAEIQIVKQGFTLSDAEYWNSFKK